MLGVRDTLTLATTKLRIRRVRLVVTLVVAGILFTALVFGSLVARGILGSLDSFASEGFLKSFMVAVGPSLNYELARDKSFTDRVEQLDAARIDKQAKEAKKLGLTFDPKSAPKAVSENGPEKLKMADSSNPSTKQAFLEFNPYTLPSKVEALAKTYGATGVYIGFNLGMANQGGEHELLPIVNGKEYKPESPGPFGPQDSLGSFQTLLTAYDNEILKPFLVEGARLDSQPGEPIPLLAPIDAVEKMLGLKPLSDKAKPAERIARLKEVRDKVKDLPLAVCYRNRTAAKLREDAAQQATLIAAHSKEAGFQKPEVVYAAPKGACEPTAVAADTRSAEAKALATKQEQFDEMFGTPKPVTRVINFRIAGVIPKVGSAMASGPSSFISSYLTSTLGEGWFISRPAAMQDPSFGAILTDQYNIANGAQQYYVNFTDRTTQKRFIEEQGCQFDFTTPDKCVKSGKVMAVEFGNQLAGLRDMDKDLNTFVKVVLGIIAAMSSIVMMGTIGKIIADSRKETSVFRAVGAKRLDIAQIYLLYTVILASLSFLIAVAIGLAGAVYMESQYSPALSAQAVLAFNAHDLSKTFHLIGFSLYDFARIYGFVLAVSLVSSVIPLLGNIRRNPVKDMREE